MKFKKIAAGALAAGMLASYTLVPNGAELFTVKASAEEGEIAIDETNFPDANFRRNVRSFDTDKDGVLSADEISAVETISLPNCRIASLEGIEYFTEVKYLTCFGNQLTELDVSKNKVLIKLSCGYNQLTELVLSENQNTALTELDCRLNKLTELDVSNYTALKKLTCDTNQLTKLKLSNSMVLTDLDCHSNKLTELDVSQNTALTELECGGNKLTELDVSKNTALETLDCQGNELTKLDLSKNTALERLICAYNQLTELDLRQNTALTYLYCIFNRLTKLNITKNTELTSLSCLENKLTKLNVSNNTKLTKLDTDTEGLTIYGVTGTYPETYAKEKGIKFVDIKDVTSDVSVSGTITVSGKNETTEDITIGVTDANGKPCPAHIDIESGELSISGLADGTYKLTMSKSKYCPRECTVTVEDGQMTGELNVELKKYGDVDGTGEINISDALQIVNLRNGKTSSFDKASDDDLKYLEKLADINNDGKVNINDALQIVNFRNGKASSFDYIT